jgi:glyoxylase-like metal-dependent hydrolase (beta-lactamase superfamily II)
MLGMEVAYTPGHASHHVCYFHRESGTAFVGDVAACVIPPSQLVMPPTPPPDIDIETWEASLDTVAAWDPQRLALTHFGAIEDPAPHLASLRKTLVEEADSAHRMSAEEYQADLDRRIDERTSGPEEKTAIHQAAPLAYQYAGLERYWRKREEREAS